MLAAVAGCGSGGSTADNHPRLKMGLMPKLLGISYFNAAEKGARAAAAELDVDLDFDGPTIDSAEDQVKLIDRWIAQGYDMIAVAPNDPELIAPALRRTARPARRSSPGMPTPTRRPRCDSGSSIRRPSRRSATCWSISSAKRLAAKEKS